MKKTAIKIAASTAVAASAFVAVAPVQQADAATNATQLATNAQNAGTVLKWAISYEGSADFKTRPFNEFNAAKKAVAAAETAAAKLGANEKLSLQAKLVDAKIQIVRATAYIDAITSSEKIKALTSNLNAAIATGDLAKVETAYHAASFEYKKQAKLLDRVYGQSTRDGIRNAVKPAMEAALDSVKYDVTVKMHIDKASALIKAGKLEEAAAELAKADYNLTLKDAKFTFKTQLQKSYDDAAVSLPLQAVSAIGDGANQVTVKFSKAYTSDEKITTLEAGQFKINGLTIQSAVLSADKKSVLLRTSTQKANTEYTVTWQGKTVSFKTPAVADTSGIAVNQTDVAYLETTDTRTFTSKLTNTDGTPYVGGVKISLTAAQITTVNGTLTSGTAWSGVTDSNGNLVFTVGVPTGSASVVDVVATIEKTDSAETSKKTAKTHFFKLAADGNVSSLAVKTFYVSAENDYVYANSLKYKWDANDQFFIRGQVVSQAAFETALSNGDTLAVDYKSKVENSSTWNITNDVTLAADVEFTNPAKEKVTFDGYNYDLSGTAQAGHTVKVYRGTTLMGTSVADASGNWTLRGVNLTQNVGNEFKAIQYAPGKDGGLTGAFEGLAATVLINEGEFASEVLSLTDIGDPGLSIGDTLNFTFERSSYGHAFKKNITGTITVADGIGQSVVVNVEETGTNTLKVTGFATNNDKFKNNSASLTVTAATGIVNQDELAYNVAESTDVSLNFGGTGAVAGSGTVSNFTAASNTFVAGGNGYTYNAATVLKNANGTVIAFGDAAIDAALANGDVVSNIVVENGVVKSLTGVTVASEQAKIAAVKVAAAGAGISAATLNAVTDLTHKGSVAANLAAYEAAIDALTAADVDTLAELQAVINKADASVAVSSLVTAITTADTNKEVKDARAAYNALSAADQAKITNLSLLVAAEKALVDAKTALAAKVVDAETVYNTQKSRLATFAASEIDAINTNNASGFTTYNTALSTLKTAIDTAKAAAVVDADASSPTTIGGATSTLDTAVGTANTAKATFDALSEVVLTGK
ncbi:hypothetical protein [Psychrobacillus antarcticus]|uniref:hypothetical protein n=1 Tax=Psychrobacillus antarcticus TaxID=2879115 RepID=UPI0024081058|nr:hypothetical protein [Psychrobacillus antarcticus]